MKTQNERTWMSRGGEDCAICTGNYLNAPPSYRIGKSLPGDTLTTAEITNGLGEVLGIHGVPFLLDRGMPDGPGRWHLTETRKNGVRTIHVVEFSGDFSEAQGQFMEWALSLLCEYPGDHARDIYSKLLGDKDHFGRKFSSFDLCGRSYSFIRVGGEE